MGHKMRQKFKIEMQRNRSNDTRIRDNQGCVNSSNANRLVLYRPVFKQAYSA